MSTPATAKMIRSLRDRKGWTQAHLAQRAGVAQSYIAMVEAGTAVPEKTLRRIARALEVSMTELTQGRLVSRLGENPEAPFSFDKGDRVVSKADRRHSGVIVDGWSWYRPGAGSFTDLYRVQAADGTFFDARGPELDPPGRSTAPCRACGTSTPARKLDEDERCPRCHDLAQRMEESLTAGTLSRVDTSGRLDRDTTLLSRTIPRPRRGVMCSGCGGPFIGEEDQETALGEGGRPLYLHHLCYEILLTL